MSMILKKDIKITPNANDMHLYGKLFVKLDILGSIKWMLLTIIQCKFTTVRIEVTLISLF